MNSNNEKISRLIKCQRHLFSSINISDLDQSYLRHLDPNKFYGLVNLSSSEMQSQILSSKESSYLLLDSKMEEILCNIHTLSSPGESFENIKTYLTGIMAIKFLGRGGEKEGRHLTSYYLKQNKPFLSGKGYERKEVFREFVFFHEIGHLVWAAADSYMDRKEEIKSSVIEVKDILRGVLDPFSCGGPGKMAEFMDDYFVNEMVRKYIFSDFKKDMKSNQYVSLSEQIEMNSEKSRVLDQIENDMDVFEEVFCDVYAVEETVKSLRDKGNLDEESFLSIWLCAVYMRAISSFNGIANEFFLKKEVELERKKVHDIYVEIFGVNIGDSKEVIEDKVKSKDEKIINEFFDKKKELDERLQDKKNVDLTIKTRVQALIREIQIKIEIKNKSIECFNLDINDKYHYHVNGKDERIIGALSVIKSSIIDNYSDFMRRVNLNSNKMDEISVSDLLDELGRVT